MRWISSAQVWKVFFEVPAEDFLHLADFHQFGIRPTEQIAIGEVQTVARRFIIRLLGVGYFVALLRMVIALAYLVGNRMNEWTTGAISVILLFGTFIPSAYWWKTRSSGLSRLRRMVMQNVRFVFDERGVTADSELGVATVGWKSIEKI